MKRILCLIIVILGCGVTNVRGGDPYMLPYRDSLVFMVHGINSDRYTWFVSDKNGAPYVGADENINMWWHYLHKTLGVAEDSIKPYSFSSSSGYHGKNMLELGGVGYKSEGGNPGAENNSKTLKVNDQDITGKTGITLDTTRTWLEQAVAEYRNGLWSDTDVNPIGTPQQIWKNADDIPDALLPSTGIDVNNSSSGCGC